MSTFRHVVEWVDHKTGHVVTRPALWLLLSCSNASCDRSSDACRGDTLWHFVLHVLSMFLAMYYILYFAFCSLNSAFWALQNALGIPHCTFQTAHCLCTHHIAQCSSLPQPPNLEYVTFDPDTTDASSFCIPHAGFAAPGLILANPVKDTTDRNSFWIPLCRIWASKANFGYPYPEIQPSGRKVKVKPIFFKVWLKIKSSLFILKISFYFYFSSLYDQRKPDSPK